MATVLDELFGQILISEQKAQERKSQLNEVKANIAHTRKKLEEIEDETQSLQAQLIEKVQLLNDDELNLYWMCKKEDILQDIKANLMEKRKSLQEEMVKLQDNQTDIQMKFCSEVWAFGQEYDLLGDGKQKREMKVRAELQGLKKKEQELVKDLDSFQAQQRDIARLETEKKTVEKQVEKLEQQLSAVYEDEQSHQKTLNKLEEAKSMICKLPQTDPEFKRLHAELENARDDTLECLCNALQQELQELQQQEWQRQLQMQKQKQQQHRQRLALRLQDTKASDLNVHCKEAEIRSAIPGGTFLVSSSNTTKVEDTDGQNSNKPLNERKFIYVNKRKGLKKDQQLSQKRIRQPTCTAEDDLTQNVYESGILVRDSESVIGRTKKIRFK